MHLIEDIGIYKNCSFIELAALLLVSIIVILPIMLSLPFKFITIGIAFISSLVLSVLSTTMLATTLQARKRNQPIGFYAKKIAIMFNGFFGIKLKTSKTYSVYGR